MKRRLKMFSIMLLAFLLTACGQSQNSIVGTWISDNDEVITFEKSGHCDIPWAYSASWMESADTYVIKDDGTLLLNSETGHADDKFTKANTAEEALDNDDSYYLSGNTLIIDGEEYKRN